MGISQTEKRALLWLKEHMVPLSFAAVTILGLLLRCSGLDFLTPDARDCLLPWYDAIKSEGGLASLSAQVGDYNMLYQLLIALLTYLPVEPLYGYKLLSILFDYVAAAGAGILACFAVGKENRSEGAGLLAYSAAVLSPLAVLNSSWWAQCDSIYTAFVLLALVALCRERFLAMFLLYGAALSFKLQAVFVLPFFFLAYVLKRKFSLINFLLLPGVMVVTALPNLAMGRSVGEIFGIYLEQSAAYEGLYFNYPSFWTICFPPFPEEGFLLLKTVAILFTLGILILLLTQWAVRGIPLTAKNVVYMAFLTCYSCVLFLPSMHERYGYLCEVLAIVIVACCRWTVPALAGLTGLSLARYGHYLFDLAPVSGLDGAVNLAVYTAYLILLHRDMDRPEEPAILSESAEPVKTGGNL